MLPFFYYLYLSIMIIKGANIYEFDETKFLGSGVNNIFSFLYLGNNIDTKEKVVIKRLNPNLLNNDKAIFRFENEGTYNFKHDNLQQLIESFKFEDNFYIILNFIEGVNLKTFSIKYKKLLRTDYSIIKKIFLDLLAGIKVIHENGYIHGGINPTNIIVTESNNEYKVTLVDYGQTRISCKRIYSKNIRFSFLYSSPEQVLMANSIVNHKSDIYSVGVCLYEVLTGEYPYKDTSSIKLRALQLNFNIQPHKLLSPDMFKIIKKATAKYVFPRSYRFYSKTEIYVMLVKGENMRYENVEKFIEALKQIY